MGGLIVLYNIMCILFYFSCTASYRITKSELVKIIANILILLPILLNLLLTALCDIGLWWVLELVTRIFQVDYAEESKLANMCPYYRLIFNIDAFIPISSPKYSWGAAMANHNTQQKEK